MKFSVFPVPKDPEIPIREPTDLLTMLPTLQFITDESRTAVRIPTPQRLSICRELLLGTIRSATLRIKIKQILTIHDRYPTNPAGLCQEPGFRNGRGLILIVLLAQVLHFRNITLTTTRYGFFLGLKERIERFLIPSHQREYPLTMGVGG